MENNQGSNFENKLEDFYIRPITNSADWGFPQIDIIFRYFQPEADVDVVV